MEYFADYGLHPNMEGIDHYFGNLWNEIKDKV